MSTKNKNKYQQVHDGDWNVYTTKNNYEVKCCNCGLTHKLKFDIVGNEVWLQVNVVNPPNIRNKKKE